MKCILTPMVTLTLLLSTVYSKGQEHFVVASDGDVYSSPQGSLSWTLGETAVETYRQGQGFLTEGFHQTYIDEAIADWIQVYPNPTTRDIYIKTNPLNQYSIELYTMQMEKLNHEQNWEQTEDSVYRMDLQHLGSTLCLLVLSNNETGKRSFFKIIKI